MKRGDGDAAVAAEVRAFMQKNILAQASEVMLTQAHRLPEGVLGLLR
ncbi:hypothetical protein [Streptomyces sp. NPDC059957]